MDDLLTLLELDLNLWLEAKSFSRPDRNQVCSISNIIAKDIQMGCSVSTVGSSQSSSSFQSPVIQAILREQVET
jgi:hypothetical protein